VVSVEIFAYFTGKNGQKSGETFFDLNLRMIFLLYGDGFSEKKKKIFFSRNEK